MKKQLLLLLCLLSASISQAQIFNDGVLEYTVISGTNVSVKKYNNVCPTGTLTIPNTVVDNSTTYTITEIENFAFFFCGSLTSLTIPNSVTSIGNEAFSSSGLTSLSIPNSITTIEAGICGFCYGLTSLTIPNSVTTIEDNAFKGCYNLTSLTIPNSVTSIGHNAFDNCGFASLTIPNSVTTIGDNAFEGCTALTSVTVNWATPLVVPTNVFQSVNVNSIPLTVPSGTVALYQAATVWQDFGSFVLSTENFTENSINVQLFPNPVQDQLNIFMSNDLVVRKICIYNNLGQLIKQSKASTIDTSDLQGIYYAQIITDKGNTTKKIIVK